MECLDKLVKLAEDTDSRFLIRFDPTESGEEWGVKLYPQPDSDAHYYSYNDDLEACIRQVLTDIGGKRW